MATTLAMAPVLSTPDYHILTETEPPTDHETSSLLSDEKLRIRYEIDRTIQEIRQHKWHRIALQFPDSMLPHSPRVYEALAKGLSDSPQNEPRTADDAPRSLQARTEALTLDNARQPTKLTILADTSYGSCCIDETAAEHVDAEVVVHYGRACLSPTARLPVIHVFTEMELNREAAVDAFIEVFPDHTAKVVLTGDIPYTSHIPHIYKTLRDAGYTELFAAAIVHDPSSPIPNRTTPPEVQKSSQLTDWHLFHIADPPTSLLLTLGSRVKSVRIYNPTAPGAAYGQRPSAEVAKTATILSRRYGLVTSMASVSTWGILINTLSVKNYLDVVENVKAKITAADKKAYLFVVGKLNAAKLANFAEIEGWVVIGCWESSLIDSRDFFRPIITPFELSLALASDEDRIWTGAWSSNFDEVLNHSDSASQERMEDETNNVSDFDSEEESAPPEFDLRTGRYVTQARPVSARTRGAQASDIHNASDGKDSRALTKRANGDMISVNGVASPAAAFLKDKRTWQGLGSDFEIKYEDEEQEGALIEEGRTGMARGYRVGDSLHM